MAGAPKGNKNAAGERLPWRQALKRSLTRLADELGAESPDYRAGLDAIADAVVQQARDGQKEAWKELGDRLEGRPGQVVTLQGDEDRPLQFTQIERHIIHATHDADDSDG